MPMSRVYSEQFRSIGSNARGSVRRWTLHPAGVSIFDTCCESITSTNKIHAVKSTITIQNNVVGKKKFQALECRKVRTEGQILLIFPAL